MTTHPRPLPQHAGRRWVLAARVLLLAVACGAVVVAWTGSRSRKVAAGGYVCPMHPDVRSTTPGQCPICRMDLEQVAAIDVGAVRASSYLAYDVARRRGTGPDSPDPAWVSDDGSVSAVFYSDEVEGLVPDARALYYPTTAPRESIELRAVPRSRTPWDSSTVRMQLRPVRDGALVGRLPAERVGWVRWVDKAREVPLIPESAVLEGPEGPYALAVSPGGNTLAKEPIRIGKTFAGLVFVVAGLGASERVLTRSAFFVDAERRLQQRPTIEIAP